MKKEGRHENQLSPTEAVACRIAVPWKETDAILLKGKRSIYLNITIESFMVQPPEVGI